jgi:hypothetical protein
VCGNLGKGAVDEGTITGVKGWKANKKLGRSVGDRASEKPCGAKEMERRGQETDAVCVRPS